MNVSKVAIVTGASRGIGRAVALQLAKDGFVVIINYVSNDTKAQQVVDEIKASGGNGVAIKADIANPVDVKKLFLTVKQQFGAIHVVVNTAGVAEFSPIMTGDIEAFDRIFTTNVRGAFNVLSQAAQHVADGGRIIAFSSTTVITVPANYGPYAASKAAVEVLTRTLAQELRGRNITVNAISPGATATEMFFEGKSEALIEKFAQMSPLGRIAQPNDIVKVVAFFASPDSGWINGQILRVNGGAV